VTPAQVRAEILAWQASTSDQHQFSSAVVAFQTRNPLHRAHFEVTRWACAQVSNTTGTNDVSNSAASVSSRSMSVDLAGHQRNLLLLLHPTVGPTQPGDIPASVRVQCYRHTLKYYQHPDLLQSNPSIFVKRKQNNVNFSVSAVLSSSASSSSSARQSSSESAWTYQDRPLSVKLALLPLAMRMGGPREALWCAEVSLQKFSIHFNFHFKVLSNRTSGMLSFDVISVQLTLWLVEARRFEIFISVKVISLIHPLIRFHPIPHLIRSCWSRK
jgi:hypothetical protein